MKQNTVQKTPNKTPAINVAIKSDSFAHPMSTMPSVSEVSLVLRAWTHTIFSASLVRSHDSSCVLRLLWEHTHTQDACCTGQMVSCTSAACSVAPRQLRARRKVDMSEVLCSCKSGSELR